MGNIILKKKQKQDALLKSAYELFTNKGVENTSISEIAKNAGIAKGTFYLYFKDKYQIRDQLIAQKSVAVLQSAIRSLHEKEIHGTEEKILFVVDHIIDLLQNNKNLLVFISKNLSWGLFKQVMMDGADATVLSSRQILSAFFEESNREYKDPELLLFMVTEFASSLCHSSILYDEPMPINELRPHMMSALKGVIRSQEKDQH